MIARTTRLRFRRKFRRSRRQVEGMGVQAEEQFERNFLKRLGRLMEVRRFVAAWIVLILLLISAVTLQLRALSNYYQTLQPAAGGTYAEGMVGSFTNANPIYATGLVDTTVSHLLFAGLLKYNDNNQLVGDLAESWKSDSEGKVYTVVLRDNLKWQDDQLLTVDDVVFTFRTIQNPDAKSPLFSAWRGVDIKTEGRTITFTLPNPLAPFASALTTGIIPKHSLENVQPAQLRSSLFNTAQPVGAGPFSWETIELIAHDNDPNLQNIGLKAFGDYHSGPPKLQHFVIKTYADEAQLIDGFQKREVNGMVGLNAVPDSLSQNEDVYEHTASLTAETGVFFRTDSPLLTDVKVRQALVQAVNVPNIVNELSYPAVIADAPLLHGQLGYNPALRQLSTNIDQANKLLEEAGWKRAPNETVRSKDATKLRLHFFAQNSADYTNLTQHIQKAWEAIGVETQVTLPSDGDLQDIINRRDYDALLYGISIGVDPDVFAYWHSSQADTRAASRLNFSDYKSSVADKALEAGRSRFEVSLRAAKYAPFLQAWRNDAPALMLYQPRFLYITRGNLAGFEPKTLNSAADRLNNVENWTIRREYTLKQ